MSLNRLSYDTCHYTNFLSKSMKQGHYHLNTPPIDCEPCYPNHSTIRLQKRGNSMVKNAPMIDVNSELKGITRKLSKCDRSYYQPQKGKIQIGHKYIKNDIIDYKDCQKPSLDTRLIDPPCTLRGTGWNRWEPLCLNPQDHVFIPFDTNINNRLVVKDNHRPCLPKPLSQTDVYPKEEKIDCELTKSTVDLMGIQKTVPVCASPF